METIQTNTDMMQSRYRPDTYHTYCWHEMLDFNSEIEHIKETYNIDCDCDDIDINYDQYKKDLGEWMVSQIMDCNFYFPEWIQFKEPEKIEVLSPRYYNY